MADKEVNKEVFEVVITHKNDLIKQQTVMASGEEKAIMMVSVDNAEAIKDAGDIEKTEVVARPFCS